MAINIGEKIFHLKLSISGDDKMSWERKTKATNAILDVLAFFSEEGNQELETKIRDIVGPTESTSLLKAELTKEKIQSLIEILDAENTKGGNHRDIILSTQPPKQEAKGRGTPTNQKDEETELEYPMFFEDQNRNSLIVLNNFLVPTKKFLEMKESYQLTERNIQRVLERKHFFTYIKKRGVSDTKLTEMLESLESLANRAKKLGSKGDVFIVKKIRESLESAVQRIRQENHEARKIEHRIYQHHAIIASGQSVSKIKAYQAQIRAVKESFPKELQEDEGYLEDMKKKVITVQVAFQDYLKSGLEEAEEDKLWIQNLLQTVDKKLTEIQEKKKKAEEKSQPKKIDHNLIDENGRIKDDYFG